LTKINLSVVFLFIHIYTKTYLAYYKHKFNNFKIKNNCLFHYLIYITLNKLLKHIIIHNDIQRVIKTGNNGEAKTRKEQLIKQRKRTNHFIDKIELKESIEPSNINDDINKILISNVNLIRKASKTNKAIPPINHILYPFISKRTISVDPKKKTLTPYEEYKKQNENKKNVILIKKNSIKTPFQFNLENSKINSEREAIEPVEKFIRPERLSIFKTAVMKRPLNLNYFKQTMVRSKISEISKTTKELQSIDVSAFDIRKRKSEVFMFPRIEYM
jgi:hypothetical protein